MCVKVLNVRPSHALERKLESIGVNGCILLLFWLFLVPTANTRGKVRTHIKHFFKTTLRTPGRSAYVCVGVLTHFFDAHRGLGPGEPPHPTASGPHCVPLRGGWPDRPLCATTGPVRLGASPR